MAGKAPGWPSKPIWKLAGSPLVSLISLTRERRDVAVLVISGRSNQVPYTSEELSLVEELYSNGCGIPPNGESRWLC